MATHPDIATIGERRKFYNNAINPQSGKVQVCSCGQPFNSCEHWGAIKTALLKKVSPDSLRTNACEFEIVKNKLLNGLLHKALVPFLTRKSVPFPFSARVGELCYVNEQLVEEALKIENKKVFLDSSKVIDHVLFLSQLKSLDIHVIWLSRDPRAQVHSAMKYNPWSVHQAANHWVEEMRKNERLLKRAGIKYTTVSYEALCKDPSQEMTKLLEFTGLDTSKFSLDFRNEKRHIMGNYNMRLGKDNEIEERKEWRKELSEIEIKDIERIAGNYQSYFGNH